MGMSPATSFSEQLWIFRPFCASSSVSASASTGGTNHAVPWMAHHMSKRRNTTANLRCTAVESQRETSSSVSSINVLDGEGAQVGCTLMPCQKLPHGEVAT